MQVKGGIMSYNYKKEYAKWKKWKDKEEALLKHYDVPNKKYWNFESLININSIQIEGL